MTFYAVTNGRNIGIFLNWNDCNNSVKRYKNALYKKFDTKEEADNFIKVNEKIYDTNNNTSKYNIIVSVDNIPWNKSFMSYIS